MIDDAARQAYDDDGVAILRGVIPSLWIRRMQSAVERVIASPSPVGATHGAFSHDLFLWRHDEDFRAFAMDSPLPEIARGFLGGERLNLFFDQLLVKEPGLQAEIKWHQDLQTFPLSGEQIISIWVPFDRATPDNGVVSYARGSHRWGQLYRDRNYRDGSGPEVPDPSTFETLQWELECGDVVVHHPLTLHGSGANTTLTDRRRALSVRYAGDDVRFAPKQPNFMTRSGVALPQLEVGSRLDHELFPAL